MILFAPLLPAQVASAEMDPRSPAAVLLPGEEPAVARAVAKRRREFAAGRMCARRAMAELGQGVISIPQGSDRAPQWPEGFVGSISHTDTWCAAAVARTADGVRALGIDVEPAEPIDTDLLRIICLAEERAFIEARPAGEQGMLARLVFSAKEAAFKCQYAVSRTMLSYHAMHVRVDVAARRFSAVFQRAAGPFRPGDELSGRLTITAGYMATAVALCRDGDAAAHG